MPESKTDIKSSEFGNKDKVLVTYQTKWFDIKDVPGIIVSANRPGGWPFKVLLEDLNGKPINLGHDDDGGEPGSGNIMYCKADNMKLVEKYIPKRLEGKTKKVWKIGDKFMIREGFSMDQDGDDEITGVVEEMTKMVGQELTVCAIIPRLGVDWIMDGSENYVWLKEWIDAVE